ARARDVPGVPGLQAEHALAEAGIDFGEVAFTSVRIAVIDRAEVPADGLFRVAEGVAEVDIQFGARTAAIGFPIGRVGEFDIAAPDAHVHAGFGTVVEAQLEGRIALGLADATPVVLIGQSRRRADFRRACHPRGSQQGPGYRNTCFHLNSTP